MPHTFLRRRLTPLVVLLGLSPAAAVAQQSSANPYYEFLQARRLEGEGDAKGALAALLRATAADPNSAEIKAELAGLYFRSNPPNRAEGEKVAKEALALDENNVEANTQLGQRYAQDVLSAAPKPATPQDIRTAIQLLERAAAGTIGTDATTQFYLAHMYLRNREPQKAVQAASRLVGATPGNPQARQLLATTYAAGGDLKGAIATLEEVVEYIPSLAQDLGRYLEQDGQLREAASAYSLALTQQPNNRQLKILRIAALYNAKDFSQAARFAAEARKQHPDDANFPRWQARALFDDGDRSGAMAVAEAAAKAFPRDAQTQFLLVDFYSDAGRSNDAERILRQMLAADPNNARVQNHLGYLLANRGDQLDEAVSLVQRALQSDPDKAEYLDSLGWAHYKKGELNDALKYLSAAAAKLPDNAEIQDHLGDVHLKRGAFQDAIAAWTKALSGNAQGVDRAAIERKLQDARSKLRR
jgi:tetratricopeptide (TPR) repeat protein